MYRHDDYGARAQASREGSEIRSNARKLSVNGLRSVESAIEAAVNSLRWKYQKESSTDGEVKGIGREEPIAEDEEVDVGTKLLMEPKIRRLVNTTQRAKQPPKMDVDFERQSSELKAKIMHFETKAIIQRGPIEQEQNY